MDNNNNYSVGGIVGNADNNTVPFPSTSSFAMESDGGGGADDDAITAGGSCEIGSLEMPPAEWLFQAAAQFQQSYGQVHPYLAAGLCIAGTLMNLVTVLVLTRPSMRSPVNVLLCAVACCDIVVESSYLVFVLHFLIASAQRCVPGDFSWAWALFMMFHAHVSVIFHAASIWMTVSLAQIRVLTIRRATTGPTTPLITERFTAVLAVLTTLVVTLVNVPNFLTFEIMEVPASAMLPCWQPPLMDEQQQLPPFTFPTAEATTTITMKPQLDVTTTTTYWEQMNANSSTSASTTPDANPMGANQTAEQLFQSMVKNLTKTSTVATTTTLASASTTLDTVLLLMMNRTRRHRLKRFQRDLGGGTEAGEKQQQPEWIDNNNNGGSFEEPMVYTVRAHESDCMKLKLAFWSNGMIFKVIPCVLLTLSIVALLRIIAEVAHKRKNLAQVMRKKVPKDHTTPMLAAILLIFLIAELPQGVFLVLNGIFSSESFHKRVYLPLGDLMDLLSLLNSAVGFLIYVGMSRKFRTVFLQLIFSALGCLLSKSPCLPTGGIPSSTGDSTAAAHGGGGAGNGNSRSWRGPATSTAGGGNSSQCQQLLCKCNSSSGHQQYTANNWRHQQEHSCTMEQPSCCGGTAATLLAVNGGGGTKTKGGGGGKWHKTKGKKGRDKRKEGGGKGGKGHQQWAAKWMHRWRRISTRTTTELLTTSNSRAKQLSICCRNSITGTPSMTLAMSYSAGITAAAASVGVHLVHLDELNNNNSSRKDGGTNSNNNSFSASPSACSLFLLALPSQQQMAHLHQTQCESRRPSSQTSNGGQYLDVPSRRRRSPSMGISPTNLLVPGGEGPKRTGSFHSLCEQPNGQVVGRLGQYWKAAAEAEEGGEGGSKREKPQKRISFNLPPEQNAMNGGNGCGGGSVARRRRRSVGKRGGGHHREGGNAIKRPSDGGGTTGFGTRLRRSFLLSLKKKQQELMLANSKLMPAESVAMMMAADRAVEGEAKEEMLVGDDDAGTKKGGGNSLVECCPGRALLKMQQQQQRQ